MVRRHPALLALGTLAVMTVAGILLIVRSDEFIGIVAVVVGLPLAVLVWLMAIDEN